MITIKKKAGRHGIQALLFILPFALFYSVYTVWPVIQGMYVSLHKWGLMGKISFVGLENYKRFFADSYFWEALVNSTKFVLISVPMLIATAMSFALLANRPSRLRKFYRISYYLPNVLSVSVISFVTIYMASPYTGFVNNLLHSVGIISDGTEPLWLKDNSLVWFTICFTTVWWTLGFSMMLYLSALQDISSEIYEAADIDGASRTCQLFRITIPLLAPTTWLVLLLQVIASYKVFGQVYLITRGGPGTITRPLIQYIYETAFTKNDMGYASAMSYALFLILVILSILQINLQKKKEA